MRIELGIPMRSEAAGAANRALRGRTDAIASIGWHGAFVCLPVLDAIPIGSLERGEGFDLLSVVVDWSLRDIGRTAMRSAMHTARCRMRR